MNRHGLTSDAFRAQHRDSIAKTDNFEPQGVSRQAALDYLNNTDEGAMYWWRVAEGFKPGAPSEDITKRALGQLRSGLELPRMQTIETGETLVKFVAEGSIPTPHSPYWARESESTAVIQDGKNISDHFGLPVGSEAPRYGMYRITAEVPTQVFINTVAPTSELSGLVTKSGGAEQVLVPNRKLFHDPVYIRSVDNIPNIAAEAERGALSSGMVRGAAAFGAAAIAYDASTTVTHSSQLLHQHNIVGAQSEVMHFGSRNLGMIGGAVLGAELGAAVGWGTGPGAFVATTVGGVTGVVAGNRIASMVDEHRIYAQNDKAGNTWHFNPKDSEKGWTRTIESTQVDLNPGSYELRPFSHQIQVKAANPELSSELSYKASGQAVQMALADAPNPQDPYSLPASAQDPHSMRESNWTRDAQTHSWNRQVDTNVIEHGQYVSHDETAGPQRSAELDRTSEAVLAQNATRTRHAIAAHYQSGFDHFDWQRFGTAPEAVTEELRQPATTQRGSDGEVYARGTDGEWSRPRWFGDKTAEGNIRDELNDALQRQSAAREYGSPETPKQPQAMLDRELQETAVQSENLSKDSSTRITPQSSNREMFDAMMSAAQNLDIDAMRSVSQNYLQSPQGQAWLEQGQQFNQQQAVVQQQAAMDAQQQSQAAAQGPMR